MSDLSTWRRASIPRSAKRKARIAPAPTSFEAILVAVRFDVVLGILAIALLPIAASGCRSVSKTQVARDSVVAPLASYQQLEIEDPAISRPYTDDLGAELPPITLSSWENGEVKFWDMTIEDAIRIGLENSQVFRELGGVVLNQPSVATTIYDPAIIETDPQFGVEGALSAFDAQWSTGMFVEKNDRALNNQFFGGGARLLRQDLAEYNSQLSKRTATGSLLTVRNIAEYDFNNAPANLFDNGAWTMKLEAEARQPLLQGRGAEFNRIAGPAGTPGFNQGVLIARVNADVALADFELAVRNLVQDIETAYWELYYGYRDLDTRADARDRALATWQRIQSLSETGQRGGEASREAQARAQFYRQQEEVQNAFAGLAQDKARTTTFRGTGGILQNERRLRLLLSLPMADGTLIRPSEEPLVTDITFSWSESVDEALTRRTELRRQRWQLKRRELELVAAKNYLLPRLDAVGRYRWRGFGHELLDVPGGNGDFDNALEDLVSGDYQEWQLGVEYKFPVGFRQAHANHRQAQLTLAREQAVLEEQERDVLAELTNAVTELDRAYETLTTNLERREAQVRQLQALETVYEDDATDESQRLRLLDLILDAQRNVAEAESRCYRGQVEYQLALRQVHYAKGSLLEYNGILLSEGSWSGDAMRSARDTASRRRSMPHMINYMMPARRVSNGAVADSWESPIATEQQSDDGVPVEAEPTTSPDSTVPQPAQPVGPPSTFVPAPWNPSSPPTVEPIIQPVGLTRSIENPVVVPASVPQPTAPVISALPIVKPTAPQNVGPIMPTTPSIVPVAPIQTTPAVPSQTPNASLGSPPVQPVIGRLPAFSAPQGGITPTGPSTPSNGGTIVPASPAPRDLNGQRRSLNG